MRRFSLRWLVLGTVLGAIMVGFTGFALYLDQVEQGNRLADIDAELVRAERSRTPPAPAGSRPGPRHEETPSIEDSSIEDSDIEDSAIEATQIVELVLDGEGLVIANLGAPNPFDPATIASFMVGDENLTTTDPRYRVSRSIRPDASVMVTGITLEDFDAAATRFRTTLLAGGVVLLGLVGLVLWGLTGLLLRPVTRMAEVANRIAAGDLDTPIGAPSGTRETAELAVDLNEMVMQLRGALNDANQSRDSTERLLADMAHEIRTPLTALTGYSDLYAQGMLETQGDVDRAMSRIGSESERLNNLASSMLRLARDGIQEFDTEQFDVAELVAGLAADLRAAYPDQHIETPVRGDGPHIITGSRERIQQAVVNLGSNACHHSPTSQPIELSVESEADAISVKVVDRGPGVPVAERKQIFLPFFRSDEARNRNGQHGAGLGLALVQQVAEQHNGSVSVTTTPGGGATFTLSVPKHTPASS